MSSDPIIEPNGAIQAPPEWGIRDGMRVAEADYVKLTDTASCSRQHAVISRNERLIVHQRSLGRSSISLMTTS